MITFVVAFAVPVALVALGWLVWGRSAGRASVVVSPAVEGRTWAGAPNASIGEELAIQMALRGNRRPRRADRAARRRHLAAVLPADPR